MRPVIFDLYYNRRYTTCISAGSGDRIGHLTLVAVGVACKIPKAIVGTEANLTCSSAGVRSSLRLP